VNGGDCLAKWTGLGVGPVRRWRRVREAVGEVGRERGRAMEMRGGWGRNEEVEIRWPC